MPPPTVLFDLDNTLYPPDSGVMPEMNRRMSLFVADYLGVSVDEAREMRRGKPQVFGTTLQWLRVCHSLHDPTPYIDAVHPADMDNWISVNPKLRTFLEDLPVDYVLFTNSPLEHARRTLSALGIDDLFPRIWDLRRMGYRGKPDRIAYERILGDLGLHPRDALLVDDSRANLDAFSRMGGQVVSAEDRRVEDWMEELADRLGISVREQRVGA